MLESKPFYIKSLGWFFGAAGLLIGCFWGLWLLYETYLINILIDLERSLLYSAVELRSDYVNLLMIGLTSFGNEFLWLVVLGMLAYLLSIKSYQRAWLFGLSALGGYMSVLAIKYLTERVRPTVEALTVESTFGFPSGHTANAVIVYGWLLYFILQSGLSVPMKWFIGICLVCLTLVAGFSRIYLGVHYPSDVFFGFVLGLVWLSFSLWGSRKFARL